MQFGKIEYFYALWGVLALALFLIWSFKRKQVLLAQFATSELLTRLMSHVSLRAQRIKALLIVLAASLLVIALAQPKWGYTWETVQRHGVDVVVAVDISRSMLATDIKPTRLDRAKRSLLDLLHIMDGDRIGLVAFSGAAFVLCPLTLDYGAAKMFVDDLSPQLISRGGTRIGDAIRKAVSTFEGQDKRYRALILITDGEDHDSDPIGAAEFAKQHGVRIFCIGIGTPDGSPIQVVDGVGKSTYLKDARGDVVLSKLDEQTLKKIAFITGGAYVAASGTGIELDTIYRDRIATMQGRELESTRRKRYVHRFQWPLAAATFLIIIEAIMNDRARRATRVTSESIT
jgi:Ca-activated chloride channel family protein